MIHRLQAYQKFGDKLYENGIVVRHLNGNRYDNSFSNTDIGTIKDNKNDILKKLVSIHCDKLRRKYSIVSIESIRKDKENGYTYSQLMRKYNITSKGSLHYILHKEFTLNKVYPKYYRVNK